MSMVRIARPPPAAHLSRFVAAPSRSCSLEEFQAALYPRDLLLRGLEMSFEAALDFIRPEIGVLRETEDHKEGLRAHLERRLPRFEGR
jgi:enoyl-CoA hydratase/carnithine racemase